MLPTFFIIGVIFAPIGGVLLWASGQVSEFTINYTNCEFSAPNTTFADIPSDQYSYSISGNGQIPFTNPQWSFNSNLAAAAGQQYACTLRFTVPKTLDASVFMYYKLTNYFQNHRRYVKSFNSDQLKGVAQTANQLNSDGLCKPLDQNYTNNLPVYPCGLIANSVFNGEFA